MHYLLCMPTASLTCITSHVPGLSHALLDYGVWILLASTDDLPRDEGFDAGRRRIRFKRTLDACVYAACRCISGKLKVDSVTRIGFEVM